MFSDPAVAKIRATKTELRKALIRRMSEIPWSLLGVSSQEVFSQMYVTGGSIGSILRFEAPSDYDVYLRDALLANSLRVGFESLPDEDKEKIVKMSATYDNVDDLDVTTILNQSWINVLASSMPPKPITSMPPKPITSMLPKPITSMLPKPTLSTPAPARQHLITANAVTLTNELQFITGFSGSPDLVRANFDFVHCLPWYDFANDKLYISEDQYHACVDKILIPNNGNSSNQKRVEKLTSKGFKYGQLRPAA